MNEETEAPGLTGGWWEIWARPPCVPKEAVGGRGRGWESGSAGSVPWPTGQGVANTTGSGTRLLDLILT